MKTQSQRLNTSKKLNDYNLAYVHLSEPLQISEIFICSDSQTFPSLYNGTLMINLAFDQEKETK
jgi:N-ethylmaleimide reductase